MKNIILLVAAMTIYSFAFAQEMEGMEMSKKEKSKQSVKKNKHPAKKNSNFMEGLLNCGFSN